MPYPTPLRTPPRDGSTWCALAFAALGYLYIALVVGAMLAVIVIGWRKGIGGLVSLPIGLLLSIVAALWLGGGEPPGVPVTRARAPALFRAIDRARGRMRAPEADVVMLTADLNASVLERPRMGLPWWPRRVLSVGLPLLHALSADEVEAILAHEFAHLSRDHNRVHRWLVRAVNAWLQLTVGLRASRNWGAIFFTPFMRGYTPRLERLTQAASRAHEFESDRLAARAAGRETAGRALLRLAAAAHRLDQSVWPAILRASWTEEAPPMDVFARVLAGLEQPQDPAAEAAVLRTVLRERTLADDSHPSLVERLENVRAPIPASLPPLQSPAAAVLVPDLPADVAGTLAEQWREAVTEIWRQAHADARACRDGTGDTDAEAARTARWARARWAAVCEPPGVAIPLLREVLAEAPEHGEAAVALATLLVASGDDAAADEAVRMLERETERDTLAAVAAAEALQRHYARVGRAADEARVRRRADQLRQAVFRGMHERSTLSADDTLRPYALAPATRAALLRALEGQPLVREAFVVQKRPRHLEGSPLVVLAVRVHMPWYRPAGGGPARAACEALLEAFHVHENTDRLVIAAEPRTRLLRRLRRIPGAAVYRDGAALPAAPAPGAEWSRPRLLARVPWPAWAMGAFIVAMLGLGVWTGITEDAGPDEPAEFAAALPALRAESERRPDDADAVAEYAWALLAVDRLAESLPVLERAVKLNPRDSRLHTALGWVLLHHGRFADAVGPLRRAVALEPGYAEAHRNLGWALYNLGRQEEAERAYRFVVELQPEWPVGHAGLGWVLIEQRRLGDAEASFRRAVQLDGANAEYLGGLGIAYLQQGRMEDAVATLRRAAARAPGDVRVWGAYGHAQHLAGDYAGATESFEHVERLDSTVFTRDAYAAGMRAASRAGHAYQPPDR